MVEITGVVACTCLQKYIPSKKKKDLIGHLLLVIVIENDGKYIYGIKKWHSTRIRNSKVFKIKIGSFYQ